MNWRHGLSGHGDEKRDTDGAATVSSVPPRRALRCFELLDLPVEQSLLPDEEEMRILFAMQVANTYPNAYTN